MASENSFELSADPFERSARTLVARVRVEAYTQHLPFLECVRQHQKFRFAIGSGANRRAREPGVADLASVRSGAAVPRMSFRPRPPFQIEEPRGAEKCAARGI